MSDYYPPNTRVLVVAPGDPYTGQVGTVVGTWNDAGDLIHTVRFCTDHYGSGCHTAHYPADELRSSPATPRPIHPRES
jgi:hypothetical protein